MSDPMPLRRPRLRGPAIPAVLVLAVAAGCSDQKGQLLAPETATPEAPQLAVVSGPVQDPASGHHYEVVVAPGLTWTAARDLAAARSHLGVDGHLLTVTSAQEQAFVNDVLAGHDAPFWMGAEQPDGAPEPAGGWTWITGEAFGFTNWRPGEPNNGGNEQVLYIQASTVNHGTWVDYGAARSDIQGYVIEYDTPPGNRAPTADAGGRNGEYEAPEGSTITLTGSADDPDDDVVLLTWICADPICGPGRVLGHGPTAEIRERDDAAYSGWLKADDGDGGVDVVPFHVRWVNVAPAVEAQPLVATELVVNAPFCALASFTDPGADSWTVRAVGPGGVQARTPAAPGRVVACFRPTTPGPVTVTWEVVDDDGGRSEAAVQGEVLPVPDALLLLRDHVGELVTQGALRREVANSMRGLLGVAANLALQDTPRSRALALGRLREFQRVVHEEMGRGWLQQGWSLIRSAQLIAYAIRQSR